MAKLMGFSDFGSKPKKRKIDYQHEAQMSVVTAESGFGNGSANGSGGNAMPLGRRRERKENDSKGGQEERGGKVEAGGRTYVDGEGGALGEVSPNEPFQGGLNREKALASLQLDDASKGSEKGAEEENLGSFRKQIGLEGYFYPSFIEDPWESLR